jgi:hypothetical protein
MKTIIKILAVCVVLTCGRLMAQTNLTTLDKIFSQIGGLTNYAIEPYLTYAPAAPKKVGGGVLGVYNVSQNVGLGLGLDWLGDFSLISANVELRAPFHPLRATFPSLTVSPFVLFGVGTPLGGAQNSNGGVATIQDAGAYTSFGRFLGGQFNVGAAYGQWTGAGPYDVKRYHIFIGWSHGF